MVAPSAPRTTGGLGDRTVTFDSDQGPFHPPPRPPHATYTRGVYPVLEADLRWLELTAARLGKLAEVVVR